MRLPDAYFPAIQVYDSWDEKYYEFDVEKLIDYRMEKIRWGEPGKSAIFLNPIDGEEEEVLLDWDNYAIIGDKDEQ